MGKYTNRDLRNRRRMQKAGKKLRQQKKQQERLSRKN